MKIAGRMCLIAGAALWFGLMPLWFRGVYGDSPALAALAWCGVAGGGLLYLGVALLAWPRQLELVRQLARRSLTRREAAAMVVLLLADLALLAGWGIFLALAFTALFREVSLAALTAFPYTASIAWLTGIAAGTVIAGKSKGPNHD